MNRPPAFLVTLVTTGEARRIRRAAGIRVTTMAAALGVAPNTMSEYEAGKRTPPTGRDVSWLRILRGLAWHETAGSES